MVSTKKVAVVGVSLLAGAIGVNEIGIHLSKVADKDAEVRERETAQSVTSQINSRPSGYHSVIGLPTFEDAGRHDVLGSDLDVSRGDAIILEAPAEDVSVEREWYDENIHEGVEREDPRYQGRFVQRAAAKLMNVCGKVVGYLGTKPRRSEEARIVLNAERIMNSAAAIDGEHEVDIQRPKRANRNGFQPYTGEEIDCPAGFLPGQARCYEPQKNVYFWIPTETRNKRRVDAYTIYGITRDEERKPRLKRIGVGLTGGERTEVELFGGEAAITFDVCGKDPTEEDEYTCHREALLFLDGVGDRE